MASATTDKSLAAELSSQLWSKAKDKLSKEDKGLIGEFDGKDNHGIVNDILASAKEKQREALNKQWKHTRKDGTVIVYREYFDKIISSITKFQEAADFLVSLDVSGHAAMPWAGVKFFLSLATKNSDKWGSVLKGMEFITREISYYGVFEVIYLRRDFRATAQLSEALVRSYTKILEYLCGARRYYEQHSYERVFKAVLSLDEDLEGTVKNIKSDREEIERLRGMIDGQQQEAIGDDIKALSDDQKANHQQLVTMLDDLAKPWDAVGLQLTEVREELGEIHAEIRAQNKKDPLRQIFEHLKPAKVADYEQKVRDLTPGTAKWIMETKAFADWSEGKTSILFISGGPGTGKSHLSTSIIDHILQKTVTGPGRPNSVGYYYFHDGDKSTQSALNALTAAVYQVATRDEVYAMHAASTCDKSPRYEMATLETVWNDFIAAEYPHGSSTPFFLVLDGIDEADRADLSELLKTMSKSLLDNLNIQILLVGRPEMDHVIKTHLSRLSYEKVELTSELNRDDIKKFSTARYDELIQIPPKFPALRRKVISTLADKAEGMFLWVDLIYKEVLREIRSPKQLSAALEALPGSGLTNVYDRIFSRIETDSTPAKRSILREIFCWVVYFKQPLSVFYLNQLVGLSESSQIVDVETILEETCGSLFEMVKMGEVLLEDVSRREADASNSVNEGVDLQKSQPEDDSDTFEDDEEDLDEDYDEEAEMEAIAEAEEVLRRRQQDILVQLRHASLGDYLRRPDLPSSAILLNLHEADAKVVLSALQVVCQGARAPQELWLCLMSNFLEQLRSLDEADVSEVDIVSIVGYLHDIFTSETIGKHIAKLHMTSIDYPLLGECFFFGRNSDLQHPNRVVVLKWLKVGLDNAATKVRSEVSAWIKLVLENPLTLLVPLTKICIKEWLSCNEMQLFLYWRYRFAWRCIIATDLIPSPPAEVDDVALKDFPDDLQFIETDPYNLLANVLSQQRSIDSCLAIAKSSSFIDNNKVSAVAYQQAIDMAREQGLNKVLQQVYLQQIRAYVDVRLGECHPDANKAIENYLAICPDPSADIFASLGVVKYKSGDFEEGIEAFQKCLEKDPYSPYVGSNLLMALNGKDDFVAMMKQLEQRGPTTTGAWICESGDGTYFLRQILHAAKMANRLDLLVMIFEHVAQNPDSVTGGKHGNLDTKKPEHMQIVVRRRVSNLAYSSMCRVWLGWLYYEYSGEHDKAMDTWKLAFFRRNEFFKLPRVASSRYSDVIRSFFGLFSQLVFDRALVADPEESGRMLSLLEDLQAQERLFWQIDRSALEDVKLTNLPLAKLYLKHGRKEQARKMLDDQFHRAIEVLHDDIEWNDAYAYDALAKLLFLNGQIENAKIAICLARFGLVDYMPQQAVSLEPGVESIAPEPEKVVQDGQDLAQQLSTTSIDEEPVPVEVDAGDATAEQEHYDYRTGTCAAWYMCENGCSIYTSNVSYTCMTCAEVEFCEGCYNKLISGAEDVPLHVCNPNHEFIKAPIKGLEKIKKQTITLNGNDLSVSSWLEQVRKDWKKGSCFS